MIFESEQAFMSFARELGKTVPVGTVFELVGDVGVGKTTFTRGLAMGLGVKEAVTSPSFAISKRYLFENGGKECELIHYDFYRLDEPGLMSFELDEALNEKNNIIVIEWGESIRGILPSKTISVFISVLKDGRRKIEFSPNYSKFIKKQGFSE